MVAETARTGAQETKQLRRAVVEAAMQIDVTISAVFPVPPRWLIKSSAGKPSRRVNKERALRELVAP